MHSVRIIPVHSQCATNLYSSVHLVICPCASLLVADPMSLCDCCCMSATCAAQSGIAVGWCVCSSLLFLSQGCPCSLALTLSNVETTSCSAVQTLYRVAVLDGAVTHLCYCASAVVDICNGVGNGVVGETSLFAVGSSDCQKMRQLHRLWSAASPRTAV
ncbi:hypothetical protein COO60DRAFT_1107611 [Scenedesmus sp. NREL 46B-D3]|nr:hypothetical protein COO60DRAFT_1107611 [Scenedesmus sp. NREL 46B-D3]